MAHQVTAWVSAIADMAVNDVLQVPKLSAECNHNDCVRKSGQVGDLIIMNCLKILTRVDKS